MRKKRILSLLLSVIMVLTVCASPFSSVFAAANTESELTGSELTQAVNTVLSYNAKEESKCPNLDLLFNNTIKGYYDAAQLGGSALEYLDPFDGVMFVLTILDIALSDNTQQPDPHEKIMEKLDDISRKIDTYHTETMDILGRIELKIDTQDFKKTIKDLGAYNSTAVTSIKGLDENQYLKGKKTLEEVTDATDQQGLKNLYKEIEKVTTDIASYQMNFKNACNDINDSNAFGLAYQLFLKTYSKDDASTIDEYYKDYLTVTMKDLILSYYCLITGWKAQENRCKLEGNTSGATTAQNQGHSLAGYLKKAINRYLKAMQTDSRVLGVKVGDGEEKIFHTFSTGWSVATESLKIGANVAVTLYKDLTATNDYNKGFAPQAYGDTANRNGYTKEGGLYINARGTLTFNLNGYQVNGINRRMNLFELANDAKLTVNGLSQEELNKINAKRKEEKKAELVQGLYNASTAIKKVDTGKTEIILNNVQMKNFMDYGVYVKGVDLSEVKENGSKFTFNTGSIEGTKNSAIALEMCFAGCTISNCEFKDNTAEKGGAIFNKAAFLEGCTIIGCKFENNTATKDGGAIYQYFQKDNKFNIEKCTFTKNTAEYSGGATYHVGNFNECTFTENTVQKSHSGAVYGAESVKNCTFTGNKSESYGGGAITVRDNQEDFYVENSTFTNNYSKRDGGAIFVPTSAYDCKPTLVKCTFKNNRSDNQGGAIFAGTDEEINVKNSTFEGNSSQTVGGAIATRKCCQAIISDSTFTGNESRNWDGGALFLTGLTNYHKMTNVTITGNTAKHRGGGIYCHRETDAAGDFGVYGQVLIENNTAGDGGNNVLLEQKNGSNTCVIYDHSDAGTKIYLDTDYDKDRVVVTNADDASTDRYFGDNGRRLYKSGSDLRINAR